MMTKEKEGYQFPDPASLFRRRLRSHWKETAAALRSVADDWTVLLYILVPALLLGGRLYYGLWKEPLPDWAGMLPFALVPVLLLLIASLGEILLLVREGDVLFLVQRREWLRGIMLRSGLYSMAAAAVKTSVCYLVLLPFLFRHFHADGLAAGGLLALTVAFEWVLMWSRHLIKVQAKGVRRWLLYVPFAVLPAAAFLAFAVKFGHQGAVLWSGALVMALLSLLLLKFRLGLRGTFMHDVQEDLVKRTRLTGLLLSHSVDKPRRVRSKTWLFRKSRPVFRSRKPAKRIAGAMVKALLRHPGHRSLYLRFAGVTALVLVSLPVKIQILAFLALHALIAYWLFLQWSAFREDAFVSLLPWPDEHGMQAGLTAMQGLLLPYSVWASALVLFTRLNPWLAAVGFIPLGVAASWAVPYLMRMFLLNKKM
ncbi:hypothetical protein J2TS6_33050 [Paenibacillus albilobatus]|uniref:Uncharacterized protein n=2 Tax=Paenibacillus TaxID=44249 RepID=A0A919XGG7_9BACL|nr:ABC transporter permease [Paenibacillus albilobatus]GIO32164.1 hypothetical protein J2TS6_33050 [Paenibacillus albilobatus]